MLTAKKATRKTEKQRFFVLAYANRILGTISI